MRRLAIIAVACATTILTDPSPAAGRIYRWVDADGQVHLGDRPPAAQPELSPVEVPPAQSIEFSPLQAPREREAPKPNRSTPDEAPSRAERCARWQEEVREIRQRQNQPYTMAEGERLEARRRALRISLLRDC